MHTSTCAHHLVWQGLDLVTPVMLAMTMKDPFKSQHCKAEHYSHSQSWMYALCRILTSKLAQPQLKVLNLRPGPRRLPHLCSPYTHKEPASVGQVMS